MDWIRNRLPNTRSAHRTGIRTSLDTGLAEAEGGELSLTGVRQDMS